MKNVEKIIKKGDLVQLQDLSWNSNYDEFRKSPYGNVLVVFNDEALVLFRSGLFNQLTFSSDLHLDEMFTKWVSVDLLEYVENTNEINIITPYYMPLGPMSELRLEKEAREIDGYLSKMV